MNPGTAGKEDMWSAERQGSESDWCGNRTANGCIATQTTAHDWIDGRRCPALQVAMADLPGARAEYRRWAHDVMVTDAPEIKLTVFSPAGKVIEVQAEYVGPIATWWRANAPLLAACWTVDPSH